MFKNKNIFISGITGSWGHELTNQLLSLNVKKIKGYSRNEFNQVFMGREYNNPKIELILGDVRDKDAIIKAMKDSDIVIHLAAVKHVPLAECQPDEAIKTNIIGTQNIIEAANKNNVEMVIDVSSDKSVGPVNIYGMTKAIGERIILNASQTNKDIKFMVVRAGNALGSSGSILQFFIDQIKKNNRVPITHLEMTRFFITLPEAIDLVLCACNVNISGGLLVMKMPSCKIVDLAEVLIEEFGNKDTKIEEIGIRPGEKIHEELISESETPWTYYYNNKYFLFHLYKKLNYKKVEFKKYSSNYKLMSKEEIKELLIRGGFIK